MNALQQDIEINRAMLRQSHGRLMAKAEALMGCAEIRESKVCSPLWHSWIGLEVAMEDAIRVENESASLLERLSSANEEGEKK
jgi:hypothetical protein